MREAGYVLDIVIGVGAAVGVLLLWRSGRWPWWTGPAYLTGCALGATWEVAFTALGPQFRAEPMWVAVQPWPLWWWSQPLVHASWDGLLFLGGAALVGRLAGARAWCGWQAADLLLLIGWGVGTSVALEWVANGSLWYYVPQPGNPRLFTVAGHEYTLWPLLTWVLAMPVFHLAVLVLHHRRGAPVTAR